MRTRTAEQDVARYNYLKVSDVGTRLSCSRVQVIELIKAGELEAIDIGLGERPEYRVAPASLDAFLERKKVNSAA